MTCRTRLTSAQRTHVLDLPSEPRELVRFYTFIMSEWTRLRTRLGSHNRLSFAVQRTMPTHPGRPWFGEVVLTIAMLQ
ncbi:MAG: DUF4158 domain-containing protein [Nitrospira sp.]|nr:DUF4158 domain-containing protein [Nitrospira sp.]